jgi:hypothetical protein
MHAAFGWKLEGRRLLGRHRRDWENNIKMFRSVDRIDMVQDSDR